MTRSWKSPLAGVVTAALVVTLSGPAIAATAQGHPTTTQATILDTDVLAHLLSLNLNAMD